MEYGYLLSLALILLSTKIFGLVTKRVKLPQVVGAPYGRTYFRSGLPWSPERN